jgi:arylformamidase
MQEKHRALGSGWIDVSVPVRDTTPQWPGDPKLQIRRAQDMEKGYEMNLTRLRMSAHTGTHVDAPLHFVQKGRSIDMMPTEAMIGKARVIQINHPEYITRRELQEHTIERGDRILFKTANSSHPWHEREFMKSFVYLSTDAAEYLAEAGVMLVGIDYLSVGGYEVNESPVHRALLEAGVWVLEGVFLGEAEPGRYLMLCLPLRIEGGDGAPARILLKPTG